MHFAPGCLKKRKAKGFLFPLKRSGKRRQGVRGSLGIHGVTTHPLVSWPITTIASGPQPLWSVHIQTDNHLMGYLTWPGMYGSGVMIGMTGIIIIFREIMILKALFPGQPVLCAAAVIVLMPIISGLPSDPVMTPKEVSNTSASESAGTVDNCCNADL